MAFSGDDGWIILSRPDERRGIWARITEETFELCAGREGGDAYVSFQVGQTITKKDIHEAYEVLDYFRWALEEAARHTENILNNPEPVENIKEEIEELHQIREDLRDEKANS